LKPLSADKRPASGHANRVVEDAFAGSWSLQRVHSQLIDRVSARVAFGIAGPQLIVELALQGLHLILEDVQQLLVLSDQMRLAISHFVDFLLLTLDSTQYTYNS
jgi:hypothetical protein